MSLCRAARTGTRSPRTDSEWFSVLRSTADDSDVAVTLMNMRENEPQRTAGRHASEPPVRATSAPSPLPAPQAAEGHKFEFWYIGKLPLLVCELTQTPSVPAYTSSLPRASASVQKSTSACGASSSAPSRKPTRLSVRCACLKRRARVCLRTLPRRAHRPGAAALLRRCRKQRSLHAHLGGARRPAP